MPNIYIDVETIPGQTHKVEQIIETIQPPSNYKKQETIDKWMEEKAPQAIADKVAKLALHPMYCQIICICMAFDEGEVMSFSGASESVIMQEFNNAIKDFQSLDANNVWIGHNIKGFDIPVIRAAYLRSQIVQKSLPQPDRFDQNNYIFDTMKTLQHQYGKFDGLGLDDLCKVLKLSMEKSNEVDGSMIWKMYQAGMMDEIVEYCKQDVEAVRDLYHNLMLYYV